MTCWILLNIMLSRMWCSQRYNKSHWENLKWSLDTPTPHFALMSKWIFSLSYILGFLLTIVFSFFDPVGIFFLSPAGTLSAGQHLVEYSWPIPVTPIWTKHPLSKHLQAILTCMKTHRDHRPLPLAWLPMMLSGNHRHKRVSFSSGSEEHTARWRKFLGQQDNGMLWGGGMKMRKNKLNVVLRICWINVL